MAGYRPSYTRDEEKKIVDFLVENEFIHRIKGDQVWKELADAKIVDRTWQSLKQHFRKQIIFELHYPHYDLDDHTQAQFKDVFNRVPVKKSRLRQAVRVEQSRKVARDFTTISSDDSSNSS